MRNPQPSISVSPPVCAGLELILKENAVLLLKRIKICIANLPRQKKKIVAYLNPIYHLLVVVGVCVCVCYIFVFVSQFLHLQNEGEC